MSVAESYPGSGVEQLNFFDAIEKRDLVSHDDALHAALLLFAGQSATTYAQRAARAKQIGLVPGGGPQGMTSPVAYWHVSDIEAKLAEVTAAGATVKEPAHDVGGGRLVATVTDTDGNVLGLLQDR
jgi:uncharacterized glyoxalase superfamily protein PhnB